MSKHYYGNGKPVNVYRNQVKLAGYHTETQSGDSVSFSDTYNDTADVELTGNTVQASDYYAKDGLSSQVQTVQSKNLFNANAVSYVSNGVTCTNNGDGTWTFNGTVTTTTNFVISSDLNWNAPNKSKCIRILAGETYVISRTNFSGSATGTFDMDASTMNDAGVKTWKYFIDHTPKAVVENGYIIHATFYCLAGAVFNNLRVGFQIEKSTQLTTFTPFVPDRPSSNFPSPITSNLAAGTYKTTYLNGDIYEFTLTEELNGINGFLDKIVHDRKSNRGILERRIFKRTFNGTETWIDPVRVGTDRWASSTSLTTYCDKNADAGLILCNLLKTYASWFTAINGVSNYVYNRVGITLTDALTGLNSSSTVAQITTAIKNWVLAQYSNGNPLVYYYVIAKISSPLSFTKVSSSSAPECPMAFLTNTPSVDYPADVVDASGNVLSNGAVVSAIPPLRKIGAVADSFVPKTGKKNKRISDWLVLDGNMPWNYPARFVMSFCRTTLPTIFDGILSGERAKVYKNDTTQIPFSTASSTYWTHENLRNIYMHIHNSDSGWNDSIVPSVAEVKAYFYGWKMCNADGSSPYYKSEVPYTPATWAEWIKSTGITGDSTGITISGDGVNWKVIKQNVTVKVNTKYGFLYEVVSSSLVNSLLLSQDFVWASIPKTVGKQKFVKVSAATTINAQVFQTSVATETGSIKLKDIRIFELPAGSQIEADFNNLTADQLAAKYTFNGLCVKNWKHIVGNQADIDASKTAVLPTASYAGYTPYKMLYQLATPVEEQYTPAPVPTHLGQTSVETDSVVKPTITATAKVPD